MKTLMISLKIFLFFTVLTGLIYPLFITGIAQLFFAHKANGSLISIDNKEVGSELIGQQFISEKYFSSRPSAIDYNPMPSGGTNYALTNSKLKDLENQRRMLFIEFNHLDSTAQVPSEILFASASGIDPDISVDAALLQVDRIARARNFNPARKQQLLEGIKALTVEPQFLCLGKQRVNVLLLNLYSDRIK
jgi:potassium-transporting ATPase KdpC subunit